MKDGKQMVKDATAVGVIATTGGLFVLRACADGDALWNAGRVARNAATVVAPLAGIIGFALAKTSRDRIDREEALEATLELAVFGALVSSALGGLASLAWDALRA